MSTIGSPILAASLANSSCVIRSNSAWAMSDKAPLIASIRSLPKMSRTPTRNCWAFLKLCKIGSRSSAPRQSSVSVESRNARSGKRLRTSPSISSSSMPGLLVKMPDRYWLEEQSSTYNLSVGGLKLKSSHSTPLPPSESLTLARLTNVESGSGVAAIASRSCGTMAARKWRQRRVDRKRIFSVDNSIKFL